MFKVQLAICAAALLLAGGAHAQSNEFATGNMHFDAKDMDTNGDHMITRDEMIKYAEKQWAMMAQGKDTIPISVAASAFSSSPPDHASDASFSSRRHSRRVHGRIAANPLSINPSPARRSIAG